MLSTMKRMNPRNYNASLSLATNLAAGFLLLGLSGFYLDRKLGSSHLWTVVGLSLGFVYGGYEVWRLVRRLDADQAGREKEDRE